jgi:hypothetical protein
MIIKKIIEIAEIESKIKILFKERELCKDKIEIEKIDNKLMTLLAKQRQLTEEL